MAGIIDPGSNNRVHRHLRRLHRIWIDHPIYLVTTCTYRRRPILTSPGVAAILRDEWLATHKRHGWVIGRYVIMPDHVHFFCSAELDAKPLSKLMQAWKQWTSKRITREPEFAHRIWQVNSSITSSVRVKVTAKNGTMCARIPDGPVW